jgi:phage I-like protein
MQYAPNFTHGSDLIALAASAALPAIGSDGAVPEWVQLLPTLQGEVQTYDGRGPYRVTDIAAIIQASMAWERGIPIDENHATDLRPGHEAPARGWIVEMQARDGGLWGRVEWTAAGRALVADKAYRGISPVLMVDPKDKRTVKLIPRASLVNVPNLCGLAALNTEERGLMEGMSKIAEKLGLAPDATLDQILAKIDKLAKGSDDDTGSAPAMAMQAALTRIGTTVGLPTGTPEAIALAVEVQKAGKADEVALQTQLATVQAELTTIKAAQKRAASEAFIDGEMKKGRNGIIAQGAEANREKFITLHMENPGDIEAIIKGMPITPPGAVITSVTPPVDKDGNVQLNAEQIEVCKLLGIAPDVYKKTLAEEAR